MYTYIWFIVFYSLYFFNFSYFFRELLSKFSDFLATFAGVSSDFWTWELATLLAMEGPRPKKVRPRRPNFTEAELLAMATSVVEKEATFFGKFTFDSAATSMRMKEVAWQDVTDAVNAVGRAQPPRDVGEVKIKFKHFKSEVKKKRG